jgi:hypothetical protein
MFCFLLLLTQAAWAQSFEGTIQWSMKADITDPATKAKMADAQAKMNDPATQAKLKEMQAKMNDPQMKAMMESNPQMKAQMENMMKMMQGGDANAMMPKGFIIKMKDQNFITMMEGGPMAMEILYRGDKGQSYRLDRQNKSFSVMPAGRGQGAPQTAAKVTKTSETTKILNYNCTKYLVEVQEGGRTITQSIWTTTDIKDIDLKNLAKQRMGRGQSIFYDGMDGVPLRIESATTEGKMTMEVTDIKRESLSAGDFVIPSDFKETPGMFGRN